MSATKIEVPPLVRNGCFFSSVEGEVVPKSSPLAKSSAPPIEALRFFIAEGDPDFSSPAGVWGDEVILATGDFPKPLVLPGDWPSCRSPNSKETQLEVTEELRR